MRTIRLRIQKGKGSTPRPSKSLGIDDFLLEPVPLVQWSVALGKGGKIEVTAIGPHRTDRTMDGRRRAILKRAAGFQRKFLKSGKLDDLRLLTPESLEKKIKSRAKPVSFDTGGSSLTEAANGQWFYGPKDGRVFAFSFLVNAGIAGIAKPRVYAALHEIVEKSKKKTTVEALTRALSKKFKKKFKADDIALPAGWILTQKNVRRESSNGTA